MPFWKRKKSKSDLQPEIDVIVPAPAPSPPRPSPPRPHCRKLACPKCGRLYLEEILNTHLDDCLQNRAPLPMHASIPRPREQQEELIQWLLSEMPPGPSRNYEVAKLVVQSFTGTVGDVRQTLITMDGTQSPPPSNRRHRQVQFECPSPWTPPDVEIQQCPVCTCKLPSEYFVQLYCGHAVCRSCLVTLVEGALQNGNIPECPHCDYVVSFLEAEQLLPHANKSTLIELYSNVSPGGMDTSNNNHNHKQNLWCPPSSEHITPFAVTTTSTPTSNFPFSATTVEQVRHQRAKKLKEEESLVLDEVLQSTNKFDDAYVLGRGRTSDVFRGMFRNKIVAVKKLRLKARTQPLSDDSQDTEIVDLDAINDDDEKIARHNKRLVANYKREVGILQEMHGHPNIVEFIAAPTVNNVPVMVMDYATHGTMYDWMFGGSEQLPSWHQRLSSCADISLALHHIHTHSPPIIHRDVKTSNVYLKSTLRAMLGDFGAAYRANQTVQQGHHHYGTRGYTDPNSHANMIPTPALDVYSLGVVLLELLTGQQACPTFMHATADFEPLHVRLSRTMVENPATANIGALQDSRMKQQKISGNAECDKTLPDTFCKLWWNLSVQCCAPVIEERPTALQVFEQCQFLRKVIRGLLGEGGEEGEEPSKDVPPLCVICCDERAVHACWPCAHVVSCDDDLPLLQKEGEACWICRSEIVKTVKVV